ncbi:MAG TPA: hypothetical protein VII06_30915 [Chloroflexota bacterium]|jgi:hypothetical protein
MADDTTPTTGNTNPIGWTLRIDTVRACIGELSRLRIHEQFAAYLCLKRLAAYDGRTDNLDPRGWKDCFETFFAVPGHPRGHPYMRPFSSRQRQTGLEEFWFNANIAGSFAPSSLRPDMPIVAVVEVTGKGRNARYSFRPEHWRLARQHLAFNQSIPVLPLAAFLYRDHALLSNDPATYPDLVSVFREEFGYTGPHGDLEFEYLYVDDTDSHQLESWFERE